MQKSPGLRPIGASDLQHRALRSLVVSIESPPLPPPAGLGVQKCVGQNYLWSLGPSILRSFFQFDFELNFGLVLGSSWARFGLLLIPFWEAKSGQVGTKIALGPSSSSKTFVFTKTYYVFLNRNLLF